MTDKRVKMNNAKTDSVIRLEEMAAANQPLYEQANLKLWAKFINHQYAAWSALFELITGQKAPKLKEINAIISGHTRALGESNEKERNE